MARTKLPTTEKYPVPDDVVTSAAMRFDELVERTHLGNLAPIGWTADETRTVMAQLLASLTRHNVQGHPFQLVTVAEYLDDVRAADHKHDHYRNWAVGAQVAIDRHNQQLSAVLESMPDRVLAAQLADDLGLVLYPEYQDHLDKKDAA